MISRTVSRAVKQAVTHRYAQGLHFATGSFTCPICNVRRRCCDKLSGGSKHDDP